MSFAKGDGQQNGETVGHISLIALLKNRLIRLGRNSIKPICSSAPSITVVRNASRDAIFAA